MQFEIETVYAQGIGKENEDAYLVDDRHARYAVVDGATGLSKLSGALAAKIVKKAFSFSDYSLIESIDVANELMQKELAVMELELQSLQKSEKSTCGFIAIQLQENQLEYAHAGDCMLFIKYLDGTVREVTYDHLAKLDGLAITLMQEKMEQLQKEQPELVLEQVVAQARNAIQDTLVKHRNLLNTPMGYGIFDGTKEAIDYMDFGKIALQNVEQLLLISDGLQMPSQKVLYSDGWRATADYAFEHGLHALLEKVTQLEHEDPYFIKYPRLKFADDKTGILLKRKVTEV